MAREEAGWHWQQGMHALLWFCGMAQAAWATGSSVGNGHICSLSTKPQQSRHIRLLLPAWLASSSPQLNLIAGLIPAQWHNESTNCRSKYVTRVPLSIKQWGELKQEVAKILLQTVEVGIVVRRQISVGTADAKIKLSDA